VRVRFRRLPFVVLLNDLLDGAVAAHGGLNRWNQVKSITVSASITGALWALKDQADALKDVRFEVDTTRERLFEDVDTSGLRLRLTGERRLENGSVILTYAPR
jgi:hypothetical protein